MKRAAAPAAVLWIAGVLAPLLIVLRLSLYAPPAGSGEARFDTLFYRAGTWSGESLWRVASEPFFLRTIGFTFALALLVTLLTLICGYVLGYAVYRAPSLRAKAVWAGLIALPKFTNLLVFVFGVKLLFGPNGFWPVVAGEVLLLVPYAALTIAASLEAVPYALVEAARGLGAGSVTAFLRVTLPLSLPGVSAAAILTWLWSASAFLGPYLLGEPRHYTVAVEVDRQIHESLDWTLAAALNVALMALMAASGYALTTWRTRGRGAAGA